MAYPIRCRTASSPSNRPSGTLSIRRQILYAQTAGLNLEP
jgi:hypothetical protein